MGFSEEVRAYSKEVWQACCRHPFVIELQEGSLPIESFRAYICQNFILLKEYQKNLQK